MAGKYGKFKYPGKADPEAAFELELDMSPMGDAKESKEELISQGEGEEQSDDDFSVSEAVPMALKKLMDAGEIGKEELMAALKSLENQPEEMDILA